MDNKNKNLSSLDISQMQQRVFDEAIDANRVYITNWPTEALTLNVVHSEEKPEPLVLDRVQHPIIEYKEIPVIVKEPQIIEVEKIIIQKEIQTIEVPVIVKEIEIKEVDRYVLQEVPVNVDKFVTKEVFPFWVKCLIFIQSLTLIGLIFIK